MADGYPQFESASSAVENRIWEGKVGGSDTRTVNPFCNREWFESTPSHHNIGK